MVQKIKLFIKYLAAMIIGAILYASGQHIYTQLRFIQDLKTISTSNTPAELYRVYSTFLNSSQGTEIAIESIAMDTLNPTFEAKIAALDVIQDAVLFDMGPRLTEGACDHRYDDVRLKSLEVYEEYLRYNFVLPLHMITTQLPFESSQELTQKKISLLSRYLFLDEHELQKQIEDNGAESIEPLLHERIRSVISKKDAIERHQQRIDTETIILEKAKEILGEDVEVYINN